MQFLTTTSEGYISLFFTLALMLVLLYFMIYRPQKKQEKKDAAMRSSLEIGDQVTTIGGVIGRVVAIKDDTFVLETGADRVKIRFTKTTIKSISNASSCIDYWQGGAFLCLRKNFSRRNSGFFCWRGQSALWSQRAGWPQWQR